MVCLVLELKLEDYEPDSERGKEAAPVCSYALFFQLLIIV